MDLRRWLFPRRHRYNELSAMIREHLEEKIADLVERGMSPEEAEYAARREFGNSTLIEDSGRPDPSDPNAPAHPVEELPTETLIFLLSSRYCEVDRLSSIALDLFGGMKPGWGLVQAICDWVNTKVTFGYQHARPTKTALDVFLERVGVCRDFQHLAVTFCRALNIPARYATGYLGDFGVPPSATPMDFSAWFQVYLGGRWWDFDARNNFPRIGRVLMAVGRDASDVALTTSFGAANLQYFSVISEEIASFPAKTPESIHVTEERIRVAE